MANIHKIFLTHMALLLKFDRKKKKERRKKLLASYLTSAKSGCRVETFESGRDLVKNMYESHT